MKTTLNNFPELIFSNCQFNERSQWGRGVKAYAWEILEDRRIGGDDTDKEITIETAKDLENYLLHGAENWKHYSDGGCSLIWYDDIRERLCTPSEAKRVTDQKVWEEQARALLQAFEIIKQAFLTLNK